MQLLTGLPYGSDLFSQSSEVGLIHARARIDLTITRGLKFITESTGKTA